MLSYGKQIFHRPPQNDPLISILISLFFFMSLCQVSFFLYVSLPGQSGGPQGLQEPIPIPREEALCPVVRLRDWSGGLSCTCHQPSVPMGHLIIALHGQKKALQSERFSIHALTHHLSRKRVSACSFQKSLLPKRWAWDQPPPLSAYLSIASDLGTSAWCGAMLAHSYSELRPRACACCHVMHFNCHFSLKTFIFQVKILQGVRRRETLWYRSWIQSSAIEKG